jgi:GNAT superfamily N-acetyltransferase
MSYYSGPREVTIREILSPQDPAFSPMMDLYETSFAEDEREPRWKFARWVDPLNISAPLLYSAEHMLVCEVCDEPVGMVFFSYQRQVELGFLVYVAVNDKHRGKGYGRRLLAAAVERCHLDAHYLGGRLPGCVMEVERMEDADPSDAEEIERRRQRLDLFAKLNAKLLSPGYVQPALTPNGEPVPLNMMWWEVEGGMPGHRIIEGFYESIFNLPADHPLVVQTKAQALW